MACRYRGIRRMRCRWKLLERVTALEAERELGQHLKRPVDIVTPNDDVARQREHSWKYHRRHQWR